MQDDFDGLESLLCYQSTNVWAGVDALAIAQSEMNDEDKEKAVVIGVFDYETGILNLQQITANGLSRKTPEKRS